MSTSVAAAPAPSRTLPSITMRVPFVPPRTTIAPPSKGSAWWKNGPTVWDGVGSGRSGLHGRRGLAAAQHDVEAIAEGPLRLREAEVEGRHQPRPRALGHGVEDGVEGEQGVAGEEHLRDEAGQEARPEDGQVDVGGPPRVRMIAPRIGAGLDRDEAVPPRGV